MRFVVSQDSSGSSNKWQSEKRAELVWVDPAHDREHTDGYQFTETFDPETFQRVDYVKEPGQSKPKPFYKHNRAVVVALGHTHQLVLVNDQYTTKLARVVVAHLADGKDVDASSAAMAQYQIEVKPDPRLIVNPEGYALSPDDRLLLVRVKLTYLSAPTQSEAAQAAQLFRPQWYVVDTGSGHVLHSYTGEDAPSNWY